MVRVFELKDKNRKIVYLSKERWTHIQKHPEMVNQIEQIKETILNPDVVNGVDYDTQVRFFYHYYKERKQYLFVSVKYLNGEAFIITSFYTDRIK